MALLTNAQVARKNVESLDLIRLRDLLGELFSKNQRDPLLDVVIATLAQCKEVVEEQALEIASLRRQLFGRRSERVALDQLSLFSQVLAAAAGISDSPPIAPHAEAMLNSPAGASRECTMKTPRKKRKILEPTRVEEIRVAEADRPCPSCDGQRIGMGNVRSLVVEYVPPKIEVIEYRREKLVCRTCEGEITVAENLVRRPVEGALPGPRLLSALTINKSVDGLPLQRTRRIFARAGQALPIQTLNRWEDFAHELVSPLVRLLARNVWDADLIHLDDTGLRVRDPKHDHGVKSGHVWTFVGRKFDESGDLQKTKTFVTYLYAPTWQAQYPRAYLAQSRAILQGDAYRGYDSIATDDAGVSKNMLVGCMMHARRPFFEAMEAKDPAAFFFIERFQRLYEIEARAKQRALTASQRLELRGAESLPILDEIRTRLDELDPLPLLKPMRKGVRYMLNQWDKLLVPFKVDGRLEVDNGEAERRLRRVASGRKSWFFAGSERGAVRFADMLSIVASAEAVGLEPGRYLAEIFEQLAGRRRSSADYQRFLPHLWQSPEHLAEQPSAEA